jgi:hypothetical protein
MSEIKFYAKASLRCPSCDNFYLRQTKCICEWRIAEDQGGTRIISEKDRPVKIEDFSEANGRRDNIYIFFECENCDKKPKLLIQQCKGRTDISWVYE